MISLSTPQASRCVLANVLLAVAAVSLIFKKAAPSLIVNPVIIGFEEVPHALALRTLTEQACCPAIRIVKEG